MGDFFDGTAHAPPPPAEVPGTFKGWVPTDYCDEVNPPFRATPEAWLSAGEDEVDEETWPKLAPKEGETVRFDGLMVYPRLVVRLDGGEDYAILSGAVPDGDDLTFGEVGEDTISDTLPGLVVEICDFGMVPAGEEIEVDVWAWRESGFLFRDGAFVAEDGAPVPSVEPPASAG